MRVHLAGSRSFGAATLTAILDAGHHVTGVTAPPWLDTAQEHYDRLRLAAHVHHIPWTDTINPTLVAPAQVIVAAHSHAFIGTRTRAAVTYAVGYHPSLLPIHRGRDAVEWTIRMRDRVAGGTVYHLTNNVDGGPIAAQDYTLVRPGDTASTLWSRDLFPLGLRLIVDVPADMDAGRVLWLPQDEALASWEPSIGRPPLHRPELPEIGGPTLTAQRPTRRRGAA